MIYTSFYNCILGKIILASDGKNLTGIIFNEKNHYSYLKDAQNKDDLEIFKRTKNWLDKYFKGENPPVKEIPVKPNGTEFQQKVWRELKNIPYGKTVSYGFIADKLNIKSARAVGNALNKNPIAIIIPCHRVIGKNGKLTGYAGGLNRKEQLLKIEKIL